MFKDELSQVINASKTKTAFLNNNLFGYFLASCLAGIYVGFGILLIFTIGGILDGSPFTKVIMGVSFGIALSLVIVAGAELFTGNNFIMTLGFLSKSVTISDTAKVWLICFIGNWIGSIVLALLFYYSNLGVDDISRFISTAAVTKMGLSPIELILRGMLCNTLVCLAVWCSFRLKSDSAKLIMVFWCLFAFITTGFEHSIANMTLLTVSLLCSADNGVTIAGYFYNIGFVTLGNMLGAILLLAIPYHIIATKNKGKPKKERSLG